MQHDGIVQRWTQIDERIQALTARLSSLERAWNCTVSSPVSPSSLSPSSLDLSAQTIQKSDGNKKKQPAGKHQSVSSPSPSPPPSTSPPPISPSSTFWLDYPTNDHTGIIPELTQYAQQLGITQFAFYRVDSGYYSWPLEQRRDVLRVPSIHHLCKSILLRNTHWSNDMRPGESETEANWRNPEYVLAIVQYTAKLHKERLVSTLHQRYLHLLNSSSISPSTEHKPLSKKQFNLRLAPNEENERITGYAHNSVTPLRLRLPVPLLLPSSLLELSGNNFALGGGEVDVKLRIGLKDVVEKLGAWIGDFTLPGNPGDVAE